MPRLRFLGLCLIIFLAFLHNLFILQTFYWTHFLLLTAKGDRELCIEAGMNDYVSKPIKRELVFEIIEKWVFDRRL